jgi:hypothetical protein
MQRYNVVAALVTTLFLLLVFCRVVNSADLDNTKQAVHQAISKGDYASAEKLVKEEAAKYAKLPDKQEDLMTCLDLLSNLSMQRVNADHSLSTQDWKHEYKQAIQTGKELIDLRKKTFGATDPRTINAILELAEKFEDNFKDADAEALLASTLKSMETSFASNDVRLVPVIYRLAAVKATLNHDHDAELLYQRGISISEQKMGKTDQSVADGLERLADFYASHGITEDNEKPIAAKQKPLLERALKIREKTIGYNNLAIIQFLQQLAYCYRDLGETDKFNELQNEADSIRKRVWALNDAREAKSLSIAGSALVASNQGQVLASALSQRIATRAESIGANSPSLAPAYRNLADLYTVLADYPKAEELYKKAIDIYREGKGIDERDYAPTLEQYSLLLKKMNRNHDAAQAESMAKAIRLQF